MRITVNKSNVNETETVTVFARFGSEWKAETMLRHNAGNPRCYTGSDEEVVARFTAGKQTLKTLCSALTAGKVKTQSLIDAGGSYGGRATIKIA